VLNAVKTIDDSDTAFEKKGGLGLIVEDNFVDSPYTT